MVYFIQFMIFLLFLCAAWLIKLFNQGTLAYRQYRKEKQKDKAYIAAEKTIEMLREEFRGKPTKFENYTAEVFKSAGYEDVTVTQASNDGGKDLIMYKNEKKYVAEVKLYHPACKISRERIQKLHSAMLDCEADRAVFVTTSDFTDPAVVYAGKHGIELVNGYLLGRWIRLLEEADKDGKNQLKFLHETMEEDREFVRQGNKAKAWRIMGLFLLLYPLYSVCWIFLLNRQLIYVNAFYGWILAELVLFNAVDLRIFTKCLIRGRQKQSSL